MNDVKRVLGIDPGITTGWGYIEKDRDPKIRKRYETLESGIIHKWHGLEELYINYSPDLVVVEAFHLYPWKAKHKTWDSFEEVEVIGVAKFLSEKLQIPLLEQTASSKKFFTDERLQEWGAYVNSEHARDAVRHAFYYLMFGGKNNGETKF